MKLRLERVGLVALMAIATITMWTGGPLLGLWVGSRVVDDDGLSMGAVVLVAAVIAVVCAAMVAVLSRLNAAYDQLTGRGPAGRRHSPWMRAMSGERPHERAGDTPLRAIEVVLVAGVAMCWVAFEVWFFFFAGSSL
ncbi:hypothetical protein [Capillimicrobium parvum]|uniref:Uncharacterized protein n=1 Tax=Capillimicrobium parvum TaxID=2884022 RepID=A0A9E6XUU2_9ACTN|nr:hypothetical protein [Capillimicrobium parvum]UGS34176.1 hypothetical protein DSM104329_00549 [Capillimicrobium parvum]